MAYTCVAERLTHVPMFTSVYFQTGTVQSSNGMLVLMRDRRGIEIWKRAEGVHKPATSPGPPTFDGAHREPSPLAISPEQEKWLQQNMTSSPQRGRYVPHGFLPSFDGMPFRIFSFHFPVLAVVDGANDKVVQLYDVVSGTLIRNVDLLKLAQARSEPGFPFQPQSVLLDIDLSDELLCATFDGDILITPIYACRLNDVDVSLSASTTPIAATGTENMTMNGSRSDSYCEAMTA